MNEDKLNKLLDLITDIVNEPGGGSWQDKRNALLAAASEDEKTTLHEFVAWFDPA